MTRATLVLLLAAALTLYAAASPSQRPVGTQTAPEWTRAPLDGSGRVLHAFSRSAPEEGAFPPAGPSDLPPAARPLPNAPGLEAGKAQEADGAGIGFPLVPSATSLDIADYARATPLVWFGGLHPIAESWSRGVASGIASTVGSRFPDWYLALPIGPGFRVRIVGAGGSVERVSTDAGPALHLQRRPFNRVADLSVRDFVVVCGVPVSFGLCPVSVTVMGKVR